MAKSKTKTKTPLIAAIPSEDASAPRLRPARRRPRAANEDATKAELTRAHIIRMTQKLGKTTGLNAVTLRDIAKASGMKAGSIYYHFASKDELIRAALKDGVGRGKQAILKAVDALGPDSSPLERLEAALRVHVQISTREPFAPRVFALRQLPRGLREEQLAQEAEYAAIFRRLIDEGEEKGLWRAGFNLAVVRQLLLGSLIWVGTWYDPKGELSLDGVADQLIGLLRGGLVRDAAS